MPNTYTQLYVQFVFAVKGRQNLIHETFRDELEKIMCGIANGLKCKSISNHWQSRSCSFSSGYVSRYFAFKTDGTSKIKLFKVVK